MFIEISAPNFSEIFLASVSFLFVLGHNLWLTAAKSSSEFRLEINTSDVFPLSDSVIKPERIKSFQKISKNLSESIENYCVEANSLVADVTSGENFYAALELFAHPITLGAEKFAGYIRHEDAAEFVKPLFIAGETAAPQRESYAKFAKVFCAVDREASEFNLTAGHRFEIVPQTKFTDLNAGKILVQILFEGKPIANLRVSSGGENVNKGKYFDHARTDANGLAQVKIPGSGHWFVRTHLIRPHSDRENFEWESFWASLTFRF